MHQTAPVLNIPKLLDTLSHLHTYAMRGLVIESTGLALKASLPNARVGDLCYILNQHTNPIPAEVVGFQGDAVFLMPLAALTGVGPGCEVVPSGKPFSIRCGMGLLGRVLNGLGEPIDDGQALSDIPHLEEWAVERPCPNPYTRQPVDRPIAMGIRALDGLLTIGRGQRMGLFAGSGVGKSTLLGQITRQTQAGIVVACLVGERGREVMDFIRESLGEEGLKRCVVVVATSDTPALMRLKSCFVATAIAEWFRDQGHDVLFLLDSITRFARAQREVGLALGEPPARQGFPPSVFALIPRLLERTGNNDKGSITAIYTVLVQGSDMEEPIADEVRGILDGHVILSRPLSERNHWPAIDVLASLSRVMTSLISQQHDRLAKKLRETLATYEKHRDLILLGAYTHGSDPLVDYAIHKYPQIEAFLRQSTVDNIGFEDTIEQLTALFADTALPS